MPLMSPSHICQNPCPMSKPYKIKTETMNKNPTKWHYGKNTLLSEFFGIPASASVMPASEYVKFIPQNVMKRARWHPRVGRKHRTKSLSKLTTFYRNRFYERDSWYKARIIPPEYTPKAYLLDYDCIQKSIKERIDGIVCILLFCRFCFCKQPGHETSLGWIRINVHTIFVSFLTFLSRERPSRLMLCTFSRSCRANEGTTWAGKQSQRRIQIWRWKIPWSWTTVQESWNWKACAATSTLVTCIYICCRFLKQAVFLSFSFLLICNQRWSNFVEEGEAQARQKLFSVLWRVLLAFAIKR